MSFYADDTVTVHHGDCLDILATLPDASVDAVVTDPPYGLEFMGKDWDRLAWGGADQGGTASRVQNRQSTSPLANAPRYGTAPEQMQAWHHAWAVECLRVLKPGGHLLAFGGTRTSHRLACAIEDVGFEIRDSIAWLYGSGFPKSLDVSKAIDKAAGVEREVIGTRPAGKGIAPGQANYGGGGSVYAPENPITAPASDAARIWQGWGTALKPAHEPVVVARKPLVGTVAGNVLAHGTGALNVDGCRVGTTDNLGGGTFGGIFGNGKPAADEGHPAGRWPANVVLDESQAAALDGQSGELTVTGNRTQRSQDAEVDGTTWGVSNHQSKEYPNEVPGGASRFFYTAKADARERIRLPKADSNATILGGPIGKVCTKCGKQPVNVGTSACSCSAPDFQPDPSKAGTIAHPTVKPLALMRWLVRLVTPPGGLVLEPFAGSGTTVEACILEGFRCVAIEREVDYLPLILQRIHRRRDPVTAVLAAAEDGGLFDLLGEETA